MPVITFIVALIGLLIERFFDWSHLRQWSWFIKFQRAVLRRIPNSSSYLMLALTILPLVIGVALIQYLLQGALYGFVELLFELFIFIYCLGPQDLWADVFVCTNVLSQGDEEAAAEKLKMSFGIANGATRAQALHKHLLDNIFIEANRRVFAMVFWFVALGPVGAVLYRLVTVSSSEVSVDAALAAGARTFENVLNWLPVRLFTLLFALGGHFSKVFSRWRKNVMQGIDSNETLLAECGIAALGSSDPLPEDGSAEKMAIHLLDRAFVIMLVIIAILVVLI